MSWQMAGWIISICLILLYVKLSLSKMTLPHQMAYLFLTEQIYRAFKIMSNEPYHK
ncbi:MAG: hypothetical protein EOP00_22965 [Pedobacter sp.]|nr:MAG: hypothetical protein EOP00_22965 [Pedobacter sp.]